MATTIPTEFLDSGNKPLFDTLPRASFDDLDFPVSRIVVTCSLRDHVHEYPHSPGGAPEKLGRKLYEFSLSCPFYTGSKLYPNLWPETLSALRLLFENQTSASLVIPTVGTITAYCTHWVETAEPKTGRNGVTVELSFREDQSDLFLVSNLLAQLSSGITSNTAAYAAALANQKGRLAAVRAAGVDFPDVLLLTQIDPTSLAALNLVLTVAGQVLTALAEAANFGFAVAALAADLVTVCSLAYDLPIWSDDTRFPLLYALGDLWLNAQQLQQDALSVGIQVVSYTVPQPGMGVGAISTALFGDASHAIDILQTNAIVDPFFVPGGTVIKAYLFTPPAQGAT